MEEPLAERGGAGQEGRRVSPALPPSARATWFLQEVPHGCEGGYPD